MYEIALPDVYKTILRKERKTEKPTNQAQTQIFINAFLDCE